MRPSFFHHLHPPSVPAEQARWRYTLGAGGIAALLVLILAGTGILELFYYVPTPEQAALSVQTITYLVPFGALIRNIHFWAAQLLVLVSGIHLARVVFTGAYAPPRRFNYLLGLILFMLSVLADFTGYVLRWDQGIQWALVVGTNLIRTIPAIGGVLYTILIGGIRPGSATLLRFYSWHILGLSLLMFIVMVWHVFRVRRDGGIAVPPPALRSRPKRIARTELARRELLAMLLSGAALIVLAAVWAAPIAAPIGNMEEATSEATAPWFFLWVQQLLRWGDPFIMGVVIPVLVLGVLAALAYIPPVPKARELGRWFPRSSRATQFVLMALLVGWLGLTIAGSLTNP